MQDDTSSLFSPKERYMMSHTARGKDICFAQLPESEQRKMRYENLHLSVGMKMENGMPVLVPYDGPLDYSMVPFTERTKHKGMGEALHFFQHDWKFASVWYNLERVTHSLSKFDCLIAPDFSLYVNDDKYQQTNRQSVYRSRFIAAYWQRCGFQVIPTASWGDVNSFKYCFDGLPEHSAIAVCGIGHDQCRSANTLWHLAIARLIKEKKPTTLVVYGGKQDDYLNLPVKVKYIPDFITQHFRDHGEKAQISTRG